ncbi:MAG: endonuclease/exonuclease/phosphatase family protein [Alphaproteobacteria bacterium]|nr:endonuclease/exonuclease/phosphatase family protein [Alphaproteobacteria bacterium]
MLTSLLLACTGGTTADPLPTEGSFDVLTYNVQGLPDALSESDTPTDVRMEQIAPFLDAFDLVGVQEDFDEGNHSLLTALATQPVKAWAATVLPDRVYPAGLAMLSRVGELVEVVEHNYAVCNGLLSDGSDCLASKGFLALRLAVGAGSIDVYVTHLDAGGAPEDEDARSSQVDELLDSIEGWSAGHAVLLMGDTNLRPSDPPDAVLLARFADHGLRDVCVELGCEEDDHIDRFLLRDGDDTALIPTDWHRDATFVDDAGADLSDHPAIVSTLRWEVTAQSGE